MTALSYRMLRSDRAFFNCSSVTGSARKAMGSSVCKECMEYDILIKISYIVSVGMQTEMEAAYAYI